MRQKRILYIAPSIGLTLDQSGGAGTHMRGTIRGFRENGIEVLPLIAGDILISPNVGQHLQKNKDNQSMKSIRNRIKKILPNKLRLLLRDIRTVRQDYNFKKKIFDICRSFKPDAIYERSAYLSTSVSRIAQDLEVPHFIETDGCMVEIISEDYGVFSRSIGNWVEKKKLEQADYVVVMNKRGISEVVKKFELRNKQFLIKTLGVEFSYVNHNEAYTTQLKKKYGIENKFIVGFAGGISAYHGVSYLIEAAGYLYNRNQKDISIMIVGWSKEGEKLKKMVEEKGLNNVIFTGKVDKSEIHHYYRLFNIGIIPDAEENFYPIKVLEYGVFALCPLVPDYSVFRDIIHEGETGCYFQHKNAHSLSESILKMFNENENCEHCGQRWYKYVKENFEWKDTVKQILNSLPD